MGIAIFQPYSNTVNIFCMHQTPTPRELTDIKLLTGYIHLRFLDISVNNIKDVSAVSSLTALLWLSADHNALSEIDMEELPHLQTATFTDNRVTSLAAISHPMLNTLSLAGKPH